MKRLLTTTDKQRIRAGFGNDPLFRTIHVAYGELQEEMNVTGVSTEEIFVNCLIGFDQIRRADDKAFAAQCMWPDTYGDLGDGLRGEARAEGRGFDEGELATATSCIVHAIAACLLESGKKELRMHADELELQVCRHANLFRIAQPFIDHLDQLFTQHIQGCIGQDRYLSHDIDRMVLQNAPITPMRKPIDKEKVKQLIGRRLRFMGGFMPGGKELVMAADDYTAMVEAVNHLVDHGTPMAMPRKIPTAMHAPDLRYTFYLAYKNEGKDIGRKPWLDFLKETFCEMQKATYESHYKKFGDKPSGYRERWGMPEQGD